MKCFMAEETELVQRAYRVYDLAGENNEGRPRCPIDGYHNAIIPFDTVNMPIGESIPSYNPKEFHGRWPTACGCGFVFTDASQKQIFCQRMYRRSDTGALVVERELPPGAFRWVEHLSDSGSEYHKARGGGPHLHLVMPAGGEWDLDSVAKNGPGWKWTGVPPLVTAEPSIDMNGKWHGWLRNGELSQV